MSKELQQLIDAFGLTLACLEDNLKKQQEDNEKRLQELTKVVALEREGYTDIKGAARYLGRTEEAIRTMVRRFKIPHYKADGKVQFKYSELESWMQKCRYNSIGEIANK